MKYYYNDQLKIIHNHPFYTEDEKHTEDPFIELDFETWQKKLSCVSTSNIAKYDSEKNEIVYFKIKKSESKLYEIEKNKILAWFSVYDEQVKQFQRADRLHEKCSCTIDNVEYKSIKQLDKVAREKQKKIREINEQMKQLNNDEILNNLKALTIGYDIMIAYYGGSRAYQVSDDYSDTDVICVLKNFNGQFFSNINHVDYFIFGDTFYAKRQQLDSTLSDYYKIHSDDILSLPWTLIYKDDKYQNELNTIATPTIDENIMEFAMINLRYYQQKIDTSERKPVKCLYHLLRIKEGIEAYQSTGHYSLEIKQSTIDTIKKYKRNYNNELGKEILEAEIKPAFEWLRRFIHGGIL